MTAENSLTQFSRSETVNISFFAKNRDGTPLTGAGTQTIKMTIGATSSGPALLEFNTSPQVTVANVPNAEFQIRLLTADLATLAEDTRYYYNIWSDNGADEIILQTYGEFYLRGSIEPA